MMEVVLVGHDRTAVAMKNAVEMIFGEVTHFHPLTFTPKEGLEELTNKIDDNINEYDPKDVLVIVDLFSGTPYNAAAGLALHGKLTDVIAGMSLPICLEVAAQMDSKSVPELVNYIMSNCNDYTKALSVVNKQTEEEDDF